MKVSLFDFDLPERFIADEPMADRAEAKLLCVPELGIYKVKDLVSLLPDNSLIIFNNTKVLPARLRGVCNGREWVATLHKNLAAARGRKAGGDSPDNAAEPGPNTWLAFIKGSKKLRIGDEIVFGAGGDADGKNDSRGRQGGNGISVRARPPTNAPMTGRVIAKRGEAGIELEFDRRGAEFFKIIGRIGEMPLPPYIKRAATREDEKNYQTVYAREPGAVAAPTAGLHFTEELLAALGARGLEFAHLTLHVGAGTFQPVKAEDTDGHIMHSEYGVISPESAERINAAKKAGRPIVAVGTTSLRLLEAASGGWTGDGSGSGGGGIIRPFEGETDIFITPGYKFKSADFLMTNFHLPRSTLFMLACAFAGTEEMKRAYEFAKENDFRFYSYGDASLLKRKIN